MSDERASVAESASEFVLCQEYAKFTVSLPDRTLPVGTRVVVYLPPVVPFGNVPAGQVLR